MKASLLNPLGESPSTIIQFPWIRTEDISDQTPGLPTLMYRERGQRGHRQLVDEVLNTMERLPQIVPAGGHDVPNLSP